jgi:putative membrane protein insertion efficiency factor
LKLDLRPVRSLVALAVVGVLVVAAFRAQAVTLAGIHFYQRSISPIAASVGIRCRFVPTCSRYAETSILRDGLMNGSWRSIKRVARCNPFTPMGTRDEP